MTSSQFATPLRSSIRNAKPRRTVTFAASHTSVLIPAERRLSPQRAQERTQLLRSRKATPHKKRAPRADAASDPRGKKPRLVESGAVRVQIDRRTNPRRGADKLGSRRLVDQGAVRVNITRHTTPRRLYATRGRIWSPPPSSCKKKKAVPQSERLPRRDVATTSTATEATPSKRRSNARMGGHKFLAALSPKYSTPLVGREVHRDDDGDDLHLGPDRSLSRTLFD